jgi:DoxX-like family
MSQIESPARHPENGTAQRGARQHHSSQNGEIVFAAYVTVTILCAVFNGAAAVIYLIGHEYPKAQADMKGVPRKWVPVLGMLLAAGTVGLLAGLAVPLLGTLAASGLVLYFIGAIIAHLRVGSRDIVGGIVFLSTAAAALALGLVHHGPW